MPTFTDPVVGGGEGARAYRFLDTTAYVRVPAARTDGRVSVVEMRLREGHAPPMHVHESADETFHVLEGRLTAHTEDGEVTVGAGETTVLPRGEPHSVVAEEPTVTIVSTTPGGFDEFVAAVGDPLEEPTPPTEPPSESAIERVEQLAGEHGIEIVGPPPVGP
jgi:quercetin dioxygenase-like cupin family protein